MLFFFQVEELTKEIHNRKEKDTSSVEVQTEDYAAWSQAGREGGDCLNRHLEQYLVLIFFKYKIHFKSVSLAALNLVT